jgi:uncharacterized protein YbaR (Trm112 family)
MDASNESTKVLRAPVIIVLGQSDGTTQLTDTQKKWILAQLNKTRSFNYVAMEDVKLMFVDDHAFPKVHYISSEEDAEKSKKKIQTPTSKKKFTASKKEKKNSKTDHEESTDDELLKIVSKKSKKQPSSNKKKRKRKDEDENEDSVEDINEEVMPTKKNRKSLDVQELQEPLKKRGRKSKKEIQTESDDEPKPPTTARRMLKSKQVLVVPPPRKTKTPLRICKECQIEEASYGSDQNLIECTVCKTSIHTHCSEHDIGHLKQIHRDIWRCFDCKPCSICEGADDAEALLICERCDRSYHYYCVKLDGVPTGDYFCVDCQNFVPDVKIEPEIFDNNRFYPEDATDVDEEIEDHDSESIPQYVKALLEEYKKKQTNLEEELFVRQVVEKEGLYTAKEKRQQEEVMQALLSKCTTEEERIQQRKTREIFMMGASRDLRTKLTRIRCFHFHLTNEELKQALAIINNEEEIIKKLLSRQGPAFLHSIRRELTKPQMPKATAENSKMEPTEEQEESEYEDDDDSDEEFVHKEEKIKKRKSGQRKGHHSVPRLLLNDALADATDTSNWSEARKAAYAKIDTNPNTYYYRFNAPGEKQKNGPFTKEEKALFLARLKEFDFNTTKPQWGIFSQAIPGRVGYQCSNFYRKLLESGELKDTSYQRDSNGKLLGKKNRVENKKKRLKGELPVRKKRRTDDEDEDDDDDNSFDEGFASIRESLRGAHNPLAGHLDPITGEEVTNPYISKYGHVLSYTTWTKALATGFCPFTKQPLTVDDLKRLTIDNIEQHRSLIKNKLEKIIK